MLYLSIDNQSCRGGGPQIQLKLGIDIRTDNKRNKRIATPEFQHQCPTLNGCARNPSARPFRLVKTITVLQLVVVVGVDDAVSERRRPVKLCGQACRVVLIEQ